MADTPPKRHYANKAARDFLRGSDFLTPAEAIRAGWKSEHEWEDFMLGCARRFWVENGQAARKKVKARHPVKRVRRHGGRSNVRQDSIIQGKSYPIATKKTKSDVLALKKRAREWAEIGGIGRSRLDNSARVAYALYLDFVRFTGGGDFPRWLSQQTGVTRGTCRNRLRAGRALAVGINPRLNHDGLIATLRERRTMPVPPNLEPDDLEEDC